MRRTTAVSEKEPPEEQDAQDKYQDVDNYFENTHSIDYPLNTPMNTGHQFVQNP
jgi:hypothetical protein